MAAVLDKIETSELPELYEDEGIEMGESLFHFTMESVLFHCLKKHFQRRDESCTVLPDVNLYYRQDEPTMYVSPDIMIVPVELPGEVRSYSINENHPTPFFIAEVLSLRTAQQGDLTFKPDLYSRLGVAEYLLVDVTGKYLKSKLKLNSLGPDGTWTSQIDTGSGVVSNYGFRVVIESDGQVRLVDEKTGRRYARPDEAEELVDEIERLKHEVARLKSQSQSTNGH